MSDEELLEELERQCEELRKRKEELLLSQQFDPALKLSKQEWALRDQMGEIRSRIVAKEMEQTPKAAHRHENVEQEVQYYFKKVEEMYRLTRRVSKLENSVRDLKEAVMILSERIDRLEGKKQRKRASS
jgi:hypothetical protein